jgi:hypothetical protein
MRPGAALSPAANSRRPFRIVSGANPVAAETSASPPYPMAIHSAAAHSRRARSLRTGDITTNLATIVASRSSSRLTPVLGHSHLCKHKAILGRALVTGRCSRHIPPKLLAILTGIVNSS